MLFVRGISHQDEEYYLETLAKHNSNIGIYGNDEIGVYLIVKTVSIILRFQTESTIFFVDVSVATMVTIKKVSCIELKTFLSRFNGYCASTRLMN